MPRAVWISAAAARELVDLDSGRHPKRQTARLLECAQRPPPAEWEATAMSWQAAGVTRGARVLRRTSLHDLPLLVRETATFNKASVPHSPDAPDVPCRRRRRRARRCFEEAPPSKPRPILITHHGIEWTGPKSPHFGIISGPIKIG